MDKKKRMIELRNKGLSYQSIGNIFGISRQRVHQLLSGYDKLNGSLNNPKGWYSEIHCLVLERDDYKCQGCDSTQGLLIHHQDEDDHNNELNNLVTLCSRCHLKIHRPRTKGINTKQVRDQNLYQYHLNHPLISMRDLASIFKISYTRVSQILKAMREREV